MITHVKLNDIYHLANSNNFVYHVHFHSRNNVWVYVKKIGSIASLQSIFEIMICICIKFDYVNKCVWNEITSTDKFIKTVQMIKVYANSLNYMYTDLWGKQRQSNKHIQIMKCLMFIGELFTHQLGEFFSFLFLWVLVTKNSWK